MRKIFATLFLLFAIASASCSKQSNNITTDFDVDNIENEVIIRERLQEEAITQYVSNLTLEQKISQLFLVSVDGTNANLSATTYHVPPGGYILFSRNTVDGEDKIISLIGDTLTYYGTTGEILPYFSIDHEGGIVNRLRGVASQLPSAQDVAIALEVDEAEHLYSLAAMQLKALGIHVNLGPMAEASYASNKDFAGTRSYGTREKTVHYSSAFLNGFREQGIYCVVKHFPGNTNVDPHYFLPVLKGDKETIQKLYVEPFTTLVADDGLLISHVIVPSFDENNPACLSPIVMDELVYNSLNFNGLVFSDDILMDALLEHGYPPEIAMSMALKAGVNVLMISHPAYWNVIPILENLVEDDSELEVLINNSVKKILFAKEQMGLYFYKEVQSSTGDSSLIFESVNVSSLYNIEKQLNDFSHARHLGSEFYNKFW